MAAYLNRTISLMSGDDPGIRGPSLAVGDARSLHDSSPLQIFVKAKKKINDIFVEIEDYVRDAVAYVQSKYKIKYILSKTFLKVSGKVKSINPSVRTFKCHSCKWPPMLFF